MRMPRKVNLAAYLYNNNYKELLLHDGWVSAGTRPGRKRIMVRTPRGRRRMGLKPRSSDPANLPLADWDRLRKERHGSAARLIFHDKSGNR
jgi:hypothetical protein